MPSSPPRSKLSRQARIALLSSLAAFGLLQLGLLAAIEIRFPEFRDPLYGRKRRQLDACLRAAPPGSPLVLLLGSSRIYNGAEVGALAGELRRGLGKNAVVYNFGLAGAGPLTELIVLNRLLADGIKPDLLVLEVFPAMLAYANPLLESDPLATSRLWRADLRLLERCDASFAAKRSEWYRTAASPWHAYRYGILGRLSTSWLPAEGWGNACYAEFDAHGWLGIDEQSHPAPSRLQGREAARFKYAPTLTDFRPGPGVAALRELVALCQREGLATVLLLTPEGEEFSGWYSPQAADQVERLVYDFGREADVPVIDARQWMSEDDFFDSHHLLAGAARRFSRRLGLETVRLIGGEVQMAASPGPLMR